MFLYYTTGITSIQFSVTIIRSSHTVVRLGCGHYTGMGFGGRILVIFLPKGPRSVTPNLLCSVDLADAKSKISILQRTHRFNAKTKEKDQL